MVTRNQLFINRYDNGQAYTEGKHRARLTEAGFAEIHREILPDGRDLIRARKAT